MTIDGLILGIIYFIAFFILFFVGKICYNLLHREFNLNIELVEKDNPAVSLAVTGYYAGLIIALGGALVGPSHGLLNDLMDLTRYGLLSIILLNLSTFICDWIILYQFKIKDELLRDRNQGTGAVLLGTSVASGFVIHGAVSGVGGGMDTAVVFWAMGQILLLAASKVYNFILPFDLHAEIEKDNVAAGVSFCGALIAMGTVVGLAAEGDFISWTENITTFVTYAITGLVSLPLIRMLTDALLMPGVKLSDEITGFRKDKSIETRGPNIGAAYIEAFSYIAGAFIIFWCI
ncbi:Uncharacterized membrane protein YjfL, UPF0719 family [Desulfocicer vacuolatum DSM 3385]|uniref:Uncharacterized membrane protein YjfL, UPF0719 family n=1 Tax=Desulfocicer vacuolatum DSM 3385 TaxID=1121400 RepID=A0A1W2B7Z3_9BACT|nr:DUF350 domain-containing protein [Desulfocicer vacuolatum]SMC68964.1 Uncharacterized membrane protein YjfL, UPF0719 family [Desulfocicer vacuolatum DSM 3385]